jgi:2-iminoacetate synthase
LTISVPRLRPCAGEFEPLTRMSDRDLAQLLCAYRLLFPDVGLVLSTRESPRLRDGLIPLGITLMSAGSHTEPGGYTGAGRDHVHRTERGRIVELAPGDQGFQPDRAMGATGQFSIADQRSAQEVAEVIRRLGYEPVWKDWESVLSGPAQFGDELDGGIVPGGCLENAVQGSLSRDGVPLFRSEGSETLSELAGETPALTK